MDGYRVEDKKPWLTSERIQSIVTMVLPIAVFFGSLLVTSEPKACGLAVIAEVMYAMIVVKIELRRETWFWVTLAVLSCSQLAAVLAFPFKLPDGPALGYVVPAMFIDGFVTFGIINLLASRFSIARSKEASDASG